MKARSSDMNVNPSLRENFSEEKGIFKYLEIRIDCGPWGPIDRLEKLTSL